MFSSCVWGVSRMRQKGLIPQSETIPTFRIAGRKIKLFLRKKSFWHIHPKWLCTPLTILSQKWSLSLGTISISGTQQLNWVKQEDQIDFQVTKTQHSTWGFAFHPWLTALKTQNVFGTTSNIHFISEKTWNGSGDIHRFNLFQPGTQVNIIHISTTCRTTDQTRHTA